MCSQPELGVAVELTPCSIQGICSTNLSEFLLRKITLRESPRVPLIEEMGFHLFSSRGSHVQKKLIKALKPGHYMVLAVAVNDRGVSANPCRHT